MHGSFEPVVGVDLYREPGRLRQDDLAVRGWASGRLAQAAQALGAAAAEYRRVRVPAPTREQPFPPGELLEPVLAARRCAERFTAVAERIRDAPFPPDPKKAWKRLRGVGAAQLVEIDRLLLSQAEYAASCVAGVTADSLGDLPADAAVEALAALAATLDQRTAYVNAP